MRLEWTRPALHDLREAGDYIALDNPAAAGRMASRVSEAMELLPEHPNMGRPGRVTGTREMVVTGTPFIVIYRVRGSAMQILRVLHHARKW
ncbi:MAG: type II toxin-antitoxin system RelE/ParE family toxin [Geobacter sp.]|nr:type II toxin-antitoxin system RelE/ParE family toxin [Geobacter sp.]